MFLTWLVDRVNIIKLIFANVQKPSAYVLTYGQLSPLFHEISPKKLTLITLTIRKKYEKNFTNPGCCIAQFFGLWS